MTDVKENAISQSISGQKILEPSFVPEIAEGSCASLKTISVPNGEKVKKRKKVDIENRTSRSETKRNCNKGTAKNRLKENGRRGSEGYFFMVCFFCSEGLL